MSRPRTNFKKMTSEVTGQDWNVLDHLKGMNLKELQESQKTRSLPYAVCIANVTGDLNVGNILRSAVCFGAERFFIIGRRKFDRRGAVGAQNYIDVQRIDALDEDGNLHADIFFTTIAGQGYTPYAVETDGVSMQAVRWENVHKPCFIFGNEGVGIPEKILGSLPTSQKIRIDQCGILRSLNVSVAAGIIMQYVHEKIR